MNEVLNVLQQYLSDETGNEVHFHGSTEAVQWFSNMLTHGHIVEHEAPDLLITNANDILLIEHFEFDSFSSSSKGSKNQIEQSRIARMQKALPATEEGVSFSDVIRGDSSYHNYCKNAIENFNKHYAKIKKYKENIFSEEIVQAEPSIRIMFLIDDVSPIGTMASDKEGNLHAVTLAHCSAFINRLEQAPDVDYVLCTSCAGNKKFIWFIDIAEITAYKNNIENYEEMQFFASNPHVIGYKIAIPDTRLQEE